VRLLLCVLPIDLCEPSLHISQVITGSHLQGCHKAESVARRMPLGKAPIAASISSKQMSDTLTLGTGAYPGQLIYVYGPIPALRLTEYM
jgi:hypothetical protein